MRNFYIIFFIVLCAALIGSASLGVWVKSNIKGAGISSIIDIDGWRDDAKDKIEEKEDELIERALDKAENKVYEKADEINPIDDNWSENIDDALKEVDEINKDRREEGAESEENNREE